MNANTVSDAIVAVATAFDTWPELKDALMSGYVPTLSKYRTAQATLGLALVERGWRVFWSEAR